MSGAHPATAEKLDWNGILLAQEIALADPFAAEVDAAEPGCIQLSEGVQALSTSDK
jgi:hypothetical protein